MASNIKIVGNILNTNIVSRYNENDINLINSTTLQEYFGGQNDYIEYYVYDVGGSLLNINYNYFEYNLPPQTSGILPEYVPPPNIQGNIPTENIGVSSNFIPTSKSSLPLIEINPIEDLKKLNYSSGEFAVRYNFFQNRLSNPFDRALFIKEISSDRTEVRLASVTLTNDEIEKVADEMINEINNSSYHIDYLLNFGNNRQFIAVNVALNKATEGFEILFKLYEPLPSNIIEKDVLWIVSEKTAPYDFGISLDRLVILPPPPQLRGPNFDIPINNSGTVATSYLNYSNAIGNLKSLQNSSYNQVLNLLTSQSIQINVNYAVSESSNFNNFVFFGSAYQRLTNFYTKVKQIEDYNNLISLYNTKILNGTSSLQGEVSLLSSSIENLIHQFDGYETYLYFESSSYSWPKSGSLKPYTLLSTSSATVTTWYNSQTSSAQLFDSDNQNNLIYSLPSFIIDDPANAPYLTFVNMIGHYFDNIWIYIKAITDVNLANNNLNEGISKDLVYEQLKSLGIKLYNSQAGDALDQFLIGANTGSTAWNNDFSPTSSYLNNIPRKDLVAELYKRIYHNLPLLLKTKGTVAGLDHLMTTFGIPNRTYYTIGSESFYTPTGSSITSSILNIKEYGGSLKSELIKGYNNDKVRIVSNELFTGSVLSPIATLQTYTTASSQFRDSDLHYIDISFSPQTQINNYISGAISSSNSTWSLDDFIGDPRYTYSSSYELLDIERKKYYQTGVSGFAPFTSSALDYNGFIRLIEFFDNALFKMLGDFVPERTSLSTGVTFESPVLERNKAVYANPTSTTTESVHTAEYPTQSMSSDYGNFYNYLGDNKKAWYDGNIEGTIVDIYNDYFESSSFNPYLLADSSSFTTASIYQFLHSDYNVLLNNVSQNITSLNRKKLEYNPGSTSSITSSVELQDSYLNSTSHLNSRYNGSKAISLVYNDYTSPGTRVSSSYFFPDVPIITRGYIGIMSASASPPYSTNGEIVEYILFRDIPDSLSISILLANSIPQLTSFFSKVTTEKSTFQLSFPPIDLDVFNGDGYIGNNQLLTLRAYSYGTSTPPTPLYGDDFWVVVSKPGESVLKTIIPYTQREVYLNELDREYSGDRSYGTTAAIDRNSYKLGWVRTVQSQSLNFYEKTTLNLKYLIDSNLQTTELSSKNTNLFEVQNTFKSGTPVKVSVTNVNTPSNQKTLDGIKTIFKGGYRYDPILYRENNESLNFEFEQPVSSSQDNLGLKLECDNFYIYQKISNTDNVGFRSNPASNPNSLTFGYNYDSNEEGATNRSIASRVYTRETWPYYTDPNVLINYTNSGGVSPSKPTRQRLENILVYQFDILKFNKEIFNREGGVNYSSTGEYTYKIPRTSNKYKINAQFPIQYFANDEGPVDAASFKAFGILEKTSNPNTGSWSYVGCTTLKPITYVPGNPSTTLNYNYYNPTYNEIGFEHNAYGFFLCQFTGSNMTFLEGDYLRFKFYILDISDIFGNQVEGTFDLNLTLGGTGQVNNVTYTEENKAIFEIIDESSFYDIYHYTSSFINKELPIIFNSVIGEYGVTQNISDGVWFDGLINPYIESSSKFIPTNPISSKYTDVVDNFSIQEGDLFRMGSFENKSPIYYTVKKITKETKPQLSPGVLAPGPSINPLTSYIYNNYGENAFSFFGKGPAFAYSSSYYYPGQINVGDTFRYYFPPAGGGTPYEGIGIVKNIVSTNREAEKPSALYPDKPPRDYMAVLFDIQEVIEPIAVNNKDGDGLTITFIDPTRYRIYFDRELESNPTSTSFAILRPKPDETSIIVDHIKNPGDVSQTLLIPGDASDTLESNAGDIYKQISVQLSQQTQQ